MFQRTLRGFQIILNELAVTSHDAVYCFPAQKAF